VSNFLRYTKTYLVGHMQYSNGRDWREYAEKELGSLNITAFNPYKHPFLKDIDEGEKKREEMKLAIEQGDYEKAAAWMRDVRSYDLNLVDRSDFIIAHLIPHVASWGSGEELVTAVRMKKPIFVSIEGGKKKTPLWILGQIPPNYIYGSIEEVIAMIKKIDSGEKEVDSERWRLLREDLR
jgi:hypothetical protein